METTRFREEHCQASRDFRNGHRERVFPYGTDKMAKLFGVRVESEPEAGAPLLAPGKCRDELLAEQRSERELSEEAHRALLNVKNAFDAEARSFEEACEASNFRAPSAGNPQRDVSPNADADANDSRDIHIQTADADELPEASDDVDVQTLRGRRKSSPDALPRRIVVLRTRHEILRPGSQSGRRAGDEPDD